MSSLRYNNSDKILVISHDVVGEQMAGPGIRYYHLARVLSSNFEVTLALPCQPSPGLDRQGLHQIQYTRGEWTAIEPLINKTRAVILNSTSVGDFPQILNSDVPVVVDGYDPLLAEWMALHQDKPSEMETWWKEKIDQINLQYKAGDFFLCASERQRDWWLGLLEASGRINPWNMRVDPSFRHLIDVVPFGLPETPANHTRATIRGVWPGIGETERILLWGGGLWPWMDPITAVRATAIVWQERQDIRLIFPGTRHPNPVMAGIPTHTQAAQEEAKSLGLLNKAIFFGDWVSFSDWPNVLLETDVALSLHFADTLETRLAFRTRVLDTIWAGIPIVATRGDATSELIQEYDLGILVDSQNEVEVGQAILDVLNSTADRFLPGLKAAREALSWEQVALPLVKFCQQPRKAADRNTLLDRIWQTGSGPSQEALLRSENEKLRALVDAYERRKIVRFLNWARRLLG